jgi:hypothetical protein
MAVRADDIALGHLGQHAISRAHDQPGHASDLGRGFSVIEIHRALREPAAAIATRDSPQLIEDLGIPSPSLAVVSRSSHRRRRSGREP